MKFYHVDNKGKNAKSHWLIAKDEADALRIASTQPGNPTNLQELKPEQNIQKLLDEGKTGLLCFQINSMKFNNVFSGMKPAPVNEPWSLYKEI